MTIIFIIVITGKSLWIKKSTPVSETASAEIRQNNAGRCGSKGIAIICRSAGNERAKQGNFLQPVVLPDLQRKGPERKEAFSMISSLVTFGVSKVIGHRACLPAGQLSGTMLFFS